LPEILSRIGFYGIRFLCLWGIGSINCEYRNYRWGHKFIRAFRAKTVFQWLFTLLHSRKDTVLPDAVTYIGYWSCVISAAAMLGALVFPVQNADQRALFDYSFIACAFLNLAGMLLQAADSILNRLFPWQDW